MMKPRVIAMTVAILMASAAEAQIPNPDAFSNTVEQILRSYNRISEAIETPKSHIEELNKFFENETNVVDLIEPESSSFVTANRVVPPNLPEPNPPYVTAAMFTGTDVATGEAALSQLQTYADKQVDLITAIENALATARKNAARFEDLADETLEARDQSEMVLKFLTDDPAGIAINTYSEGGLGIRYAGEATTLDAASRGISGLAKDWRDEANRLQVLLELEKRKHENLLASLSVLRIALDEMRVRQRNAQRLAQQQLQQNREIRIGGGGGFATHFTGTASNGEDFVEYSGTRHGSSIKGTYEGDESGGIFLGSIDRLNRVRGGFADDDKSAGLFVGKATPSLSSVFGKTKCLRNCTGGD